MAPHVHQDDQPIGEAIQAFRIPAVPTAPRVTGRYGSIERFDAQRHSERLFAAFIDAPDTLWTYLADGPFDTADALTASIESRDQSQRGQDPTCVTYVVEVDGAIVGMASYLRIAPAEGSIEIGYIVFSPTLQRTPASTEALYLMINMVMDLGYRRCEWKCDSLNAPSQAAAQRLGFTYEGTFRQATHYRGRNRDTAWFSILDREWPDLEVRAARWLEPTNFDLNGHQITKLGEVATQ